MNTSLHEFTQSLEAWYSEYGRDLPWRKTTDPYAVWISEIMLQQTQVDRVKDSFYPRFLERFPTIKTLAAATWEEVYPYWKGLGYYNRGKNLIKAAQYILTKHNGVFPKSLEELSDLPGVGKYTACAILAFAYDYKFPAIDTNIKKIIHVIWPRKNTENTARDLISYAHSGRDWNNAMMDLATALRAREKIYGPLGDFFPPERAQKFIPEKKKPKKKKRKHTIEVGIACIYQDGKYLIQSRPKGKSFEGMWEFPGGKREKKEDIRACVKREIQEELGVDISVRPHFFEQLHTFEKVLLLLRFHRCQIQSGTPAPLEGQHIQWVAPKDFDSINFLEANAKAVEKLKHMKM